MEILKSWSWITLFIYLGISIFTAILFKFSIKAKKNKSVIRIFKFSIEKKYIYYCIIIMLFIIFSSFRYIGKDVGGADTLTYINYFNDFKFMKFDIKETLLLNGYEFLFYNLMFVVKALGGNFRIFLILVNFVISLSLVSFVDCNVNDEKYCFWLILAYLPMLKSLNIVRNCIAASLAWISITFLSKENYKLSLLFMVLAYLNHYIALIILVLILFYRYCSNKILSNRKIMLVLNVTSVILAIVALPLMKVIMLKTGYSSYVNRIQISIIGYVPYFLIYFFMILDTEFKKYLDNRNHLGYYKVISFLMLILPIFIVINAAYRILLFFDLPMILMLIDISDYYEKYIPDKFVKVYKILLVLISVSYYIFRICRMWSSSCIMPYYNILFM